jgi:hypothetical protein
LAELVTDRLFHLVPLLLRTDDVASIDALLAFEEITHIDDRLLDTSPKGGPKSFKREKVASVLRTLFPDYRPKMKSKELSKIIQDYLRSVDGTNMTFGRSTLYDAISIAYGTEAGQELEE